MTEAVRIVETSAAGQPWSPRITYVRVDGVDIRVARHGPDSAGPPLLLIHGIGANIEMWEALVSLLPHRPIVMFDFPGTGGSQPLRSPRRMSGLASLVVRLLDELEIDSADVLGYSWGGTLAQQLVHDAPRRVRRLVLAATTPGLGAIPLS